MYTVGVRRTKIRGEGTNDFTRIDRNLSRIRSGVGRGRNPSTGSQCFAQGKYNLPQMQNCQITENGTSKLSLFTPYKY